MTTESAPRVALLTGAARRIGAITARTLHAAGWNIVIHYRRSSADADALVAELNDQRAESAIALQADLLDMRALPGLARNAHARWGRLDLLVNNASSFYPTPVGSIDEAVWDDLVGSNMKAPLFLSQAAAPMLAETRGAIVNIVDIHAVRPLAEHPVYCMAKAGLAMMTRSLARELGPDVRVNGVAPGAILWPEAGLDEAAQQTILDRVALKRPGNPQDIADAVAYFATAGYVTGQILAVDGGRSTHG